MGQVNTVLVSFVTSAAGMYLETGITDLLTIWGCVSLDWVIDSVQVFEF